MSSIIAKADPALLMRHEQSILELEGFTGEYQGNVAERLRLMALDTDSCWKELEVFCEGHKNDPCIDRAGLPYAERLAEAIARDESSAERVLSLLSQKNPMVWMEGLAVHVAGLIRLEAAVPMLVNKLIADRDCCLNEQCQYAFQKIGTDFAVETFCKDFHAAPWHYRLYASASLERIHTDLAVSKCQELLKQELLQQEEDSSVPWNLMAGVLGGFCLEGIEPVRQLTIHGNHELRKELLGVAILMGVLFPELETLKEDAKKRDEEIARRMGLLTNGPKRKPPAPSFDHLLAPPPQAPIGKKSQVGRNEPCPCGSGKKYKKCCGKNE